VLARQILTVWAVALNSKQNPPWRQQTGCGFEAVALNSKQNPPWRQQTGCGFEAVLHVSDVIFRWLLTVRAWSSQSDRWTHWEPQLKTISVRPPPN